MPTETLHEHVERVTEAGDLRLVYGIGVPFLLVVAAIVGFLVLGNWWLAPALAVVLIVMIGVIIAGFTQMLEEDDDSSAIPGH